MNSNIQNLIHRAVNNRDFSKKCGSVSVENGDIYSYGLMIASNVKGVWVLYGDTYSVTTTRHQGFVRQAVRGQTIDVGVVPSRILDVHAHTINMQRYERKYNAAIDKLSRAKSKKQEYIVEANRWVEEQIKYIDLYSDGLTTEIVPKLPTVSLDNMDALTVAAKAETARKAEIAAQKALEAATYYKELLGAWLSGEHVSGRSLTNGVYDYWRVVGDNVESTRGVTLSKAVAVKAYELLKSGHAVSGSRIAEHYHVTQVSDTVAVVGCHKMLISHLDSVYVQIVGGVK